MISGSFSSARQCVVSGSQIGLRLYQTDHASACYHGFASVDATTFAVFEDELGSFLREQEDELVSGANLISTLPE